MWFFTFSSILTTFSIIFQSCSSETCPISGNAHRCVCNSGEIGINVLCSHIELLKELRNAVDAYQNHKIESLTIKDSTFEFLPHDLFQSVRIKHLTITNSFSRIGNLGEPQFKGLETSLETLKFDKAFSKQYPLAFVHMEHLMKLRTLEVHSSYVEMIHNRWLKDGPKSLRVVRFVKGNIRVIGHNALNSLTNLRIIDLSENELTYIPRWAFPEPAVYLTELNLERNKLATLPDDFFNQMPNLAKVNLELNEFSTIDETIWGEVWQNLDYINVDYNPMVCDYKIKWIIEKTSITEEKLAGTCYKPFNLMDRDIHSLKLEELK